MAKTTRKSKAEPKKFYVFGSDPATGQALPNRTVTEAEWRKEKLGELGYVKPDDLDDGTQGK